VRGGSRLPFNEAVERGDAPTSRGAGAGRRLRSGSCLTGQGVREEVGERADKRARLGSD